MTDSTPLSLIDFPPHPGYIYNSMKMRTGFINRLFIAKEEIKQIESQSRGRKQKPSVADDPNSSSLFVVMRVLHLHYRENEYLIKGLLTDLVSDQEQLSMLIKKSQI